MPSNVWSVGFEKLHRTWLDRIGGAVQPAILVFFAIFVNAMEEHSLVVVYGTQTIGHWWLVVWKF
jgi:hypothetical protein